VREQYCPRDAKKKGDFIEIIIASMRRVAEGSEEF
jgi:hypothetical protein